MVKQYYILESHNFHFTDLFIFKKPIKYESLFSLWEIPCMNIILVYVVFYVGLMISFYLYDTVLLF